MSEINEKLDEVIEFLENHEGSWSMGELVSDILNDMPELEGIMADEVSLEHEGNIGDLDNFAKDFFIKTVEKIVTSIESFKEETP